MTGSKSRFSRPAGLLALWVTWLIGPPLAAAEDLPGSVKQRIDVCVECHGQDAEFPVLSIYHTAHGMSGDENSPLGGVGCESCHGESAAHNDRPRREAPGVGFGPKWTSAPEVRSQVCLECHTDARRSFWAASSHEQGDVACDDCHVSHATTEPVLANGTQNDLCIGCHGIQRAEFARPSRHPVREGELACSDCHDPHGSGVASELKEPTLNDTCYGCHTEKRGPFIFEHPPAAENCGECHVPHGSVQPSLLVSRTPFLCQQCHLANFHPSVLIDGKGTVGRMGSSLLLGKNCMNCHSRVHGTNHPSGARLTR